MNEKRGEDSARRGGRRKFWGAVLRWGVGLGVLALILLNVSLKDCARHLTNLVWAFVFANLALKIVLRCLAALKWHLIVRIIDPAARYGYSLVAYFVGTTIGSVLPVFGTDLTVMYSYYRQSGKSSGAVSTVLVDRVIALGLIVLLANGILVWNIGRFSEMPVVAAMGGAALAGFVALATGGGIVLWRPQLLRKVWLPRKLKQFLGRVREDLLRCRKEGMRVLVWNAALSLVTQCLRIASMYTLALAVGLDVALVDIAVISPLMFLLAMLPIPAASIGWEQGVFVVMLGTIGIASEAALAMSILNRVLIMISLAPGIFFLLMNVGLERSAKQQENPAG